jgi:hypothetical protein
VNIRKVLYFRLLNSSHIFSISFNLRLTFLCLISCHITRDISEIRIQKAVSIKYISIITFSIINIQRYAFSIRMRVCLYSFWNKNEYLINKIRKREKYSLFHKSLQVIYSNVLSENLIAISFQYSLFDIESKISIFTM